MIQNKLSFHQSSASLEIIGLPDYSNNENKDQISIISQWKLTIVDKPLIEGKIEHLGPIMDAFYIYSNLLIKNEIPIYESKLIDIKADNLHIHNIVLKSSKPNVKPLVLRIGNSLLSDTINCFDQLNESPKVRIKKTDITTNVHKKLRFGLNKKVKFFNFFKENLNILNLANLINECRKKIFLNKLKIQNFRNHKSFEIDLKEQRAIVLGCYGIGKSNLLESVEFLSQLKSNRALSDKDLIENDSDMAEVTGQIDFRNDLKLNLFRKGPKKIYVNESILKKQSDIKNYIRSVCFCSNDIDIVRSEPSYRRTWIDKVVSQLEPVYLDLISRFNRLLKQRSHFWRSESFLKTQSTDIIESFDIQMSIISTRIFRRRRRA